MVDLCESGKEKVALTSFGPVLWNKEKSDGALVRNLGSENFVRPLPFLDSEVNDEKGYRAIAIEKHLTFVWFHTQALQAVQSISKYIRRTLYRTEMRFVLKSALDVVWSK